MYRDIEIDGELSMRGFKELLEGPVGYSIARTARILDMTRQSVDAAIRKDALHATRFYLVAKDSRKKKEIRKLISTEVDRESVHAYAMAKQGRNRIPYGYTDDQIPLFS